MPGLAQVFKAYSRRFLLLSALGLLSSLVDSLGLSLIALLLVSAVGGKVDASGGLVGSLLQHIYDFARDLVLSSG